MRNRERIHQHYTPRVQSHRDSFDILDWSSPEAQQARFRVLLRVLRGKEFRGHIPEAAQNAGTHIPGPVPLRAPAPYSLLDAGCGLADLRLFLLVHGVHAAYVGVDLTPAILREGRRRQPATHLVQADLFEAAPFRHRSFDVVFASGIFNLNLENNEAFVRKAVPALFGLARVCLVANFLHVRTSRKYPHCSYYCPAALSRDFATLTHRLELVDDYLDNDFSLVLWRD